MSENNVNSTEEIVLSVEIGDAVSAQTAEAYAVGKRGGVDVAEADPTWHNNAKYYAEQAEEAAGEAQGAEEAAQRAETAQAAAEAAQAQAAASAGTAGQQAAAAAGSAQDAATAKTGAETAQSAAAGSATAAEGSAGRASQSATAAAGSATAAGTAKTAAETARDAAAGSATAAAGSASAADQSAQAAAASAQAAEDVAESIPADYSQLSDDVTGLKSATIQAGTRLPTTINDCDDIPPNKLYLVSSGQAGSALHMPYTTAFLILSLSAYPTDATGNWQIAKRSNYTGSNDMAYRIKNSNGVWSLWKYFVNSDDIVNFSDVLPSTHDDTDRTAEIYAKLQSTGKCQLGNGVYYIKGLQMPDNTMIVGQGDTTRVIMIGSAVTNVFNPTGIENAWGAATDGVYQGKLSDLSDVPIATEFEENVQYIVRMTAKNTAVSTSTSIGLRVRVKYTDSDTKVTAFGFTLDSSDWQTKTYTTEAGRTVESITYNYSSGGTSIWAIKDIGMLTQSGTPETGNAIEVGHQCAIRNLWLTGSEIDCPESLLAVDGGRNGLYIAPQKYRISVENCYISDFTGNGIYAINDSTNVVDGSHFDNNFITRNHVGLNFYDKFEYNRVSNCSIGRNYIGVVNNGGNNLFTCCGFNANFSKGFVIDNLDGIHNNSGHGSCVGCNFNHNGHNTGDAIYIGGSAAGFVFDGCNIFYGHITLNTASRVIFSGINFGSSIVIDITGGDLVIFNASSFRDDLVTNIANNGKVRFVACYDQDGVVVDPTT